jgi:putative endonuclease
MRASGAAFEQRACTELERAGFKLLARNYTTRYGELDLVMMDRGIVVFVEVRHRVRASHGGAAASVTSTKQARLIAAAQLWLAANPRFAQSICRFDVVSYDGLVDQAHMHHWRSAFEVG